MQPYCLITGSTADLTDTIYVNDDVKVMPYPYFLNDTEYANDPFAPFDVHAFYDTMRNGALPTTSNLNSMNIETTVTDCFKQGLDVLYVAFSHALSSTYDVAVSVQKTLKEKYPDRKLVIVDSLSGSTGMGIVVQLAARYRQEGLGIDEAAQKLTDMRMHVHHLVTVSDLGHLFRGGRISRTAATVGKLAAIKPILTINRDGHLAQSEKVNGRRKSMRVLAKRVSEDKLDPKAFDMMYVIHGDCVEDAQSLRQLLMEQTGFTNIDILPIGPVIGAHTGPDALAVTYVSKNPRP